jgi:hypothetical protein
MKKVLLGILLGLLALSAAPLAAHAQMPGEKCDLERLGTTKRATDDQNIIACLKTGETAQNRQEITEWKAMTSSGSGGLTGGCHVSVNAATSSVVDQRWGTGCKPPDKVLNSWNPDRGIVYHAESFKSACSKVAMAGYACGPVWIDEGMPVTLCLCVKK